jgi:hypothetical protein
MPHWNELEVEEQRFTLWRNPTEKEMKIDIHDRPGRRKRYVIPPGGEARIPSEFDQGIHVVRNGIIVGGYAPLLERVAGNGTLSPVLDPEAQARRAAEEEADRTVIAKRAADEVLARAQAPAPPATSTGKKSKE